MKKRIEPWFAALLALMALGLGYRLWRGASPNLIILIVLVAVIWFLYKYPPDRWMSRWRNPARRRNARTDGRGGKPRPDFRSSAKAERRKQTTFTVIDGRKDKDDEPPRYH